MPTATSSVYGNFRRPLRLGPKGNSFSAYRRYVAPVLSDEARAISALLTTRRKRLEDLKFELARPFEHEARLTTLVARQRELLHALDLTRDEVGSAGMDANEQKQVA